MNPIIRSHAYSAQAHSAIRSCVLSLTLLCLLYVMRTRIRKRVVFRMYYCWSVKRMFMFLRCLFFLSIVVGNK